MVNRYLEKAGFSYVSPLFCQLSKTKYGYKPRSKVLSYSWLRELELEAFKDIVTDISAIGTAAANAGVPDRVFFNVIAAGLVNRLWTGMSKILYLHVCRFLRL